MKVGIFTDSYKPEISGLVSSICTLKQALEGRGHEVFVFAPSNSDTEDEERVFRLPSMPVFFEKSLRLAIGVTPEALSAINRYKLDIIHTQTEFSLGIFGKIVARGCGLPLVHTYHTMYKDYLHYFVPGARRGARIGGARIGGARGKGPSEVIRQLSEDMVRAFSRDFCNSCDAVIAPTEKVRELLAAYGVKRPIRVLPSGVRLERFEAAARTPDARRRARAELGIDDGTPLAAFIGRIAKEKSIDMIIRAMPSLAARLPEVRLLVVGEGPERQALEALAAEICPPGRCIFAGSRPWAEIPDYYRAADAFVTASVTETQGLTVLEAMAAEIPVAARQDPSFSSMIRDGKDGLLFSSQVELSDALYRILSDAGTARSLVGSAREKARSFSAQAFGGGAEAVYEEAIRLKAEARERDFFLNFPRVLSARTLALSRDIRQLFHPPRWGE
jgi:1,2-diacylglycerol 3-alpha-glucosyltransferase